MLHFNPLAIEATQDKWEKRGHAYSSRFEMVKDLTKALKYDLLVKNPYDLVINNSKNVLFAVNIGKTKRVAAGAIVVISSIYTIIMYGALVHSFGSSLRTIAFFTNSNRFQIIACAVRDIGSRIIYFGTSPAQLFFYKIPKGILFDFPCLVNDSVGKISESVFNNFLRPLFKIIKKVIAWNYFQLLMAARVVFDYTSEAFSWTRQNIFKPFWKIKIEPKVNLFRETLKDYRVFAR